eukprot:scaffold381397_cov43-Prasinocladus_malaysianus.AAC.1
MSALQAVPGGVLASTANRPQLQAPSAPAANSTNPPPSRMHPRPHQQAVVTARPADQAVMTTHQRVVLDSGLAPRLTPTGAAMMVPIVPLDDLDGFPSSAAAHHQHVKQRGRGQATVSTLVLAWGLGLSRCTQVKIICDGVQ